MPLPGLSAMWEGMADAVRGRFVLFFTLAAPFTLLVDMAMRVFGPAPPQSMEEVTLRTTLWLLVVPGLAASLGQLTVTSAVLEPGQAPRQALAVAIAAWPAYLLALAVAVLPTMLGFLLLVLPGLYVSARLYLLLPIAISEPSLGAVAMVRRSWELTAPVGWTLFAFFVLALLGVIGASIVTSGLGSALGSVLTIAGQKGAGHFVAGLVAGGTATCVSVASAAFAGSLYRRLA